VRRTRLNTVDEFYLHLDREQEPWSVHVEIRVDGRVDARELRALRGFSSAPPAFHSVRRGALASGELLWWFDRARASAETPPSAVHDKVKPVPLEGPAEAFLTPPSKRRIAGWGACPKRSAGVRST
jgi:hypothetical protein